jgi:hypothetical protein
LQSDDQEISNDDNSELNAEDLALLNNDIEGGGGASGVDGAGGESFSLTQSISALSLKRIPHVLSTTFSRLTGAAPSGQFDNTAVSGSANQGGSTGGGGLGTILAIL